MAAKHRLIPVWVAKRPAFKEHVLCLADCAGIFDLPPPQQSEICKQILKEVAAVARNEATANSRFSSHARSSTLKSIFRAV